MAWVRRFCWIVALALLFLPQTQAATSADGNPDMVSKVPPMQDSGTAEIGAKNSSTPSTASTSAVVVSSQFVEETGHFNATTSSPVEDASDSQLSVEMSSENNGSVAAPANPEQGSNESAVVESNFHALGYVGSVIGQAIDRLQNQHNLDQNGSENGQNQALLCFATARSCFDSCSGILTCYSSKYLCDDAHEYICFLRTKILYSIAISIMIITTLVIASIIGIYRIIKIKKQRRKEKNSQVRLRRSTYVGSLPNVHFYKCEGPDDQSRDTSGNEATTTEHCSIELTQSDSETPACGSRYQPTFKSRHQKN